MIVALVGVICFSFLLAVNWTVARSPIYPGVGLTGIWLLEFIAQVFAVGALYPISWDALDVFVTGAICFTGGAALAWVRPTRLPKVPHSPAEHRGDIVILLLLGALLVLGLPFYMEKLRSLTSAPLFSPASFLQVRHGLLGQAATRDRAPLVDNLVVLSTIVALIAYAVTNAGQRARVLAWALIALALFYNLLTASKAGAVLLVVALFAIHTILRERIPVRFLLFAAAGLLIIFGVVAVGRMESLGEQLTWQQSVTLTWDRFLEYFSASPVGFSIYLDHPTWIPPVWSPWRFFEHTANYFGNYFKIPNSNAQFVNVGSGIYFNTYTAYFSFYPPYGIGGVMAFMSVLGWTSSCIYRRALHGKMLWIVIYSTVFYGVIATVYSEALLGGLNFMLKLAAVSLVIEGARRIRFRRTVTSWSRVPLCRGN